MITIQEFEMINVARAGIGAALILSILPAGAAGIASPEEMLRDFQSADRNSDNQVSFGEYKMLQERLAAENQNRVKLPVYVNGFEFHYPRHNYYYFPDGSFIDDQGPERFYR